MGHQQPTPPGPALPALTRGRTLVMGVLNATPDSFYDGGKLRTSDDIRQAAEAMVDAGADILDIGGESSRPGAEPVGAAEELDRVLPALEAVRALGVPVSVDTWRAETARAALAAGASMINDITALGGDPALADVVAAAGCPVVLMHMQGQPKDMQKAPRYDDVVAEILNFFEERIQTLKDRGILREQLWLDPGFGFGKTVEHNLEILRRLQEFKQLGLPLLLGTSNKSTIGTVLGLPPEARIEGTAATVAIGIYNGADAVRVHNVQEMARVATMTNAIRFGWNAGG